MNAGKATAPAFEVSLQLERRHVPVAEYLLLAQGALAVTLTDQGDTPLWEPGVGETPLWEAVCLTGLFDGGTDAAPLLAALTLLPLTDEPVLHTVEERAWERAWMDRFAPMRFGDSLWIVPTGAEAPDADATLLRLDPGLAFGTGTHPTTRLCLEWLDSQDLEGRSVLDFGCGSGVLGIAAALRGARTVRCIDHDPQAIEATTQNAERNGVAGRIDASRGDRPGEGQADVVIANILAGILQQLAPDLVAALAPGGRLLLTGILVEQAEGVRAAYAEAGLRIMPAAEIEGWVRMEGERT